MKNGFLLLLAATLSIQLASPTQLMAQDDGDLFAPPPSAMDTSGGGNGSSDFSGGGSGRSNGGTGVLSSSQKSKFSKAPIEDITNENFPETIESFDFPNADINDIVKAISELTGKNFIVDQGVRGKITIIAPTKITVAEAYKAFLSALAINGYALVPSGGFIKIRSARNAQRDNIDTFSGNYFPNSDAMITRIIHLKHISAEAVNRDLRILTSKDGEMSIYSPTNSLIISDYGANIERIMKIINQLDVPGFEDQLEVIPIRFAKAKEIADLIDKIINKGDKNTTRPGGAGTFSSGVPRYGSRTTTTGGTGSAYFMVIPDDRTNSLIVTGNKAGIIRIKRLLTQLDFKIRPEDSGGVNVYYVKYGEAEKIAQTLSGIAKDATPKPSTGGTSSIPTINSAGLTTGPAEIFGGEVKISADKGTNSLIVVASKQDYEVVLNLLSKIDIPRDQVFVEAIIMEMRVTDSFNWEAGVFKYDPSGSGLKTGFNGLSKDTLGSIFSPVGGNGAILGFGSNEIIQVKPPGATTATPLPSLLSLVSFLKKNAQANVLSTPQILALDNQEATIEVGDKVVVSATTTAATATSPSTTTPTFEDATIKLKIKPFISPASNSIRMELNQSVKQISTAKSPVAFDGLVQPLATRNIQTNIVVNNGDTAVLGGLMKEDDVEEVRKVPLLGDIPILGWLFKSRTTSKEKTNMLVFITPKIIRTNSDAKTLLNKKLNQRLNYIKSIGGRDPYGETVDQLQKSANDASEPEGSGVMKK